MPRKMIKIISELAKERYQKLLMKTRFPIPIVEVSDALRSVGIELGDSLLVHSSIRSFYRGAVYSKTRYSSGEAYAEDLIRMFLDFAGEKGILMMPTEFIEGYQRAATINAIYSLKTAKSRRGQLTEMLRNWEGVLRSTHPIYNVCLSGRGFDEALQDHWDLPYTMDVGSPWYKFMEIGGKVIFFGVPMDNNSIIHMPEYILKSDYPRPVFFNRPHIFNIEDMHGVRRQVPAYVHAITWPWGTVSKFLKYLNEKYGIYKTVHVHNTPITVFSAREQYDALMKELEHGVSWYDAIYWD